jgi:hypothetical protein
MVGTLGNYIGPDQDPRYVWPLGSQCFDQDRSNSSYLDWSWRLKNGSIISKVANPEYFHCPPERVKKTLQESKDVIAAKVLNIAGIAADRSALGLPFFQDGSGYMVQSFERTFGTKGLDRKSRGFRWASQCLPVLTDNPVQCRHDADYSFNGNVTNVTFHGHSEKCSLTIPVSIESEEGQEYINSAGAARACPGPHEPGKVDLLIGAVGLAAVKLFQVKQYNEMPPQDTNDTVPWVEIYGFSCQIDIEPTIGFRLVNLSTVEQGRQQNHSSRFSISSPSRERCTPVLQNGQSLQDLQAFLRFEEVLASGAGASALLLDNWNTLSEVLSNRYSDDAKGSFFPSSTNAFEDLLGLASAIGIGMHWGSSVNMITDQPFRITNGRLTMIRARVGKKDTKAIMCIFPSALTAILLILLAADRHRRFVKRESSSKQEEPGIQT